KNRDAGGSLQPRYQGALTATCCVRGLRRLRMDRRCRHACCRNATPGGPGLSPPPPRPSTLACASVVALRTVTEVGTGSAPREGGAPWVLLATPVRKP